MLFLLVRIISSFCIYWFDYKLELHFLQVVISIDYCQFHFYIFPLS